MQNPGAEAGVCNRSGWNPQYFVTTGALPEANW